MHERHSQSSQQTAPFGTRVKQVARQVAFLGGAMLLGSLGLGGMCDPTPPPAECGCAPGAKQVCVDKCAVPVKAGGRCSMDPCAENGTCETGLTCFSLFGNGQGTCVNLGGTFYTPGCYPEPALDVCSNDLFCRPSGCAGDSQDRCVFPAREGSQCDVSSQPACLPCEPGTDCVANAEDKTYCHVPCANDQDCPCGSGMKCTGTGLEVPAGYCYDCTNNLGGSCSDENPCCRSDLKCENGACCHGEGLPCSTNANCCGSSVCEDGVCVGCKKAGEPASAGQCCSGLNLKDGICSIPCPTSKCNEANLKGECANGKWSCTATDKVCVQPAPQQEKCDGLDNDCDGQTDESFPQDGQNCGELTPGECPNPPGFTVPGHYACHAGSLQCVARACDPTNSDDTECYCTQCGGRCGECYGNSCSQSHLCSPNLSCQGTTGCSNYDGSCQCVDLFCPYETNVCWRPEQLGPFPGACAGDPTKK